ncbi:MAG: hypothetical protein WC310_03305 [Patescibacteria group bacterium]|jgi:hypothetical protein
MPKKVNLVVNRLDNLYRDIMLITTGDEDYGIKRTDIPDLLLPYDIRRAGRRIFTLLTGKTLPEPRTAVDPRLILWVKNEVRRIKNLTDPYEILNIAKRKDMTTEKLEKFWQQKQKYYGLQNWTGLKNAEGTYASANTVWVTYVKAYNKIFDNLMQKQQKGAKGHGK